MSNARAGDKPANRRTMPTTRGVVYLHCCPSTIAPHVEWALAGVLGRPVRLEWTGQPVAPTHLRAEASWTGAVGTGAGGLRLRNCPFHPLAASAPDLVCALNHEFVQGMLDGLQADSAVEAVLAPHPGECCVALRPRARA